MTNNAVNNIKIGGNQWIKKSSFDILDSKDLGSAFIEIINHICDTVQKARSSRVLATTCKITYPIISANTRSLVNGRSPERSAYETTSQKTDIHNKT
mmetsp:Transcript_3050/g.3625  ORF Transcript_3050/g.3625 Transcript_3050/m.3625 type:complete len:97 (+) Transcript_3050:208-498(+)